MQLSPRRPRLRRALLALLAAVLWAVLAAPPVQPAWAAPAQKTAQAAGRKAAAPSPQPPAQQDGQRPQAPREVRHDIEVSLDPQRRLLSGKDTLSLSGASGPLTLSLAQGAEVAAVTLDGRKLPHRFDQGRLSVELPAKSAGKSVRLAVEYRIRFDQVPPDNPVSADDPSYGVVGTVSDKGVFLLPEAGWYPRLPGPPTSSRLAVTAPAPLLAVSEGRLLGHELVKPPAAPPAKGGQAGPKALPKGSTTVSVYEVGHPQDGLSLVAGPYKPVVATAHTAAGDVPVAAYFYPPAAGAQGLPAGTPGGHPAGPKDADLAASYLDAAAGYVELYAGLLGPYPFAKFDVVENFFPTGYGFASYTLLGSRVIRLPFITRTSLGHEIVHSWFGNSVLVDYSRGNWAEGVTVYLADYYLRERESAAEARDYRLQVLRNYSSLIPEAADTAGSKDFPLAEFRGRMSPESQAVGYGKAAMVFHMARRKVGDEAFWAGLREIVRADTWRRIAWDDFADAFATASEQGSGRGSGQAAVSPVSPVSPVSGEAMRAFFGQWVSRPGGPRLSLEGVTAAKASGGWQVSGTVRQRPPVYDLDLPVRVSGGAESERADVTVHAAAESTPFSFTVPFKPARVAGDPDVDVFRRLWPEEIPPTVNTLRGADDLVVVASDSLDRDTLAAALPLPASLGQGRAAVLKEAQATGQALAGRSVLFLGLPRSPALLDLLAAKAEAGLDLRPDRFAVGRDTFAAKDEALFAVLRRPQDNGDKAGPAPKDARAVALFLPLSPQAATACLRKIQHYGRYSYLVFSAGDNRAKGTWTSRSPLDIGL